MTRGRPFPKGTSGNAQGRPKGSKNALPLVRALVNEVRAQHDAAAREAYRRALTNPRTVLDALKLEAQLNREIGTGPKLDLPDVPVTITLHWPGEEDGGARSEQRRNSGARPPR